MTEEISLLQQAFAETGVQLDRIIDAYKRKNGPFVPIGFPAYAKCNDNGHYEYIIEIPSRNASRILVDGAFYVNIVNGVVSTESSTQLFSFDEMFNITILADHLEVEWVDSSTLPQS